MKKVFLILVLAIFSLTTFAQDELSFGVSTLYQVKETSGSWAGWEEASSPVLIYLDLGFGFVAVENGYKDRFIVNTMELSTEDSEQVVFTLKCSDKDAKPCTLFASFFATGNFALTVQYSDISYAYFISSDMAATGYPYKYFENKKEVETTGKFKGTQL